MMVEDAGGQTRTVHVRKEDWEPLGLTLDQTIVSKPRPCRNHCIFCFIDQMPPGMRKTLYVKDDDWRLSLMMGNYITMTNIDDHELDRIIRRKVSPLFVSVQCTDPDMRVKLLRNPNAAKIMDNLRLLKANGIRFHAQMVLCPGWNDGEILKKSLEDLETLRPAVQSIALVPIGLTKFRDGLPYIKPYNKQMAADLIESVKPYQERFLREIGTRLVSRRMNSTACPVCRCRRTRNTRIIRRLRTASGCCGCSRLTSNTRRRICRWKKPRRAAFALRLERASRHSCGNWRTNTPRAARPSRCARLSTNFLARA